MSDEHEDGGAPTLSEIMWGLRPTVSAGGTLHEIVDEDVRGNVMPVFRNRARSLVELLDGSARFGDRTYLVQDDVRLDYAANLGLAGALAAALQRAYSVRPGDRVALFAANRWEWAVAFWAITAAGGVPAAFNGFWTPDEVSVAVELVEPVLVIGDGARLERLVAADVSVPTLSMDHDLPDVFEAHRGETPEPTGTAEDDPAVLIFTSGTTGRPKAVTIAHRTVCGFAQVNSFNEAVASVAMGGPVPMPGDEAPPSDDVVLVTAPLFHVSMLYGAVLQGVLKGSAFVLLPGRFDPEQALRAIDRERVTMWMALGSAAPRVCAHPDLSRHDTSSLRFVGVGGAPVSPAVQQGLREAFPTVSQSVAMAYTSTEGGSIVASISGPDLLVHPTSTGRVTATVEVELRDELGRPVAEGELGEVHVRSPYVMLGYWNDPEASAAVLGPGGWLAMGDMARMVDGLLHIDSRARDMILVSAENVSPTEVEYRLEAHPSVLEAAVLAVDDPLTGDAVCAVVSVDPDDATTVEDLDAWCREVLAHYKVPTVWHLVTVALPRTPSGKLVKHRLRDQIDRGLLLSERR